MSLEVLPDSVFKQGSKYPFVVFSASNAWLSVPLSYVTFSLSGRYLYSEFSRPSYFSADECLNLNDGYAEGILDPVDQVSSPGYTREDTRGDLSTRLVYGSTECVKRCTVM